MYLLFNVLGGANVPICAPAAEKEAQTSQVKTGSQPELDVIDAADLTPEGRTTLKLIKDGGPFPYDKDGTVFNNYEGLLPDKANGYYHEYTVVTPGSVDRGARRIVAGAEGEYYYTSDHYASFKLIQE
ncbi:MAG: ribonuclease [Dehalococcoidia bacterium]|nr:ribonuclease [Dehalococcoidia bacterium]